MSLDLSAIRQLILNRLHVLNRLHSSQIEINQNEELELELELELDIELELELELELQQNQEIKDFVMLLKSIKKLDQLDQSADEMVENWLTHQLENQLEDEFSSLANTREKRAMLLDFWYKGRHQLPTTLVKRIKSERIGSKAEWLVDIDEISEYLWYIL